MAKEAEYETRCPACDEPIYPGEPIELNADEEWCHEDCAGE